MRTSPAAGPLLVLATLCVLQTLSTSTHLVEAAGAQRVQNSETCWGCWSRGALVLSWPECLCRCDDPADLIRNGTARYVRRNIQAKIDPEDEESKYVTLLGPTCRYLSSERKTFAATFNVPMNQVTAARFRRGIINYLGLFFEDQYHFHSLDPHPTRDDHSVLRFDVRDDGTGNNISAALLTARSPIQIYQSRLTDIPATHIPTGEPVVSIELDEVQIAPTHKEPVIGTVEGYPIYVGTGYFFFSAMLLCCLMALLEAACSDNVAGDGMSMKEWMAPRAKDLPDGDGRMGGVLSEDIAEIAMMPVKGKPSMVNLMDEQPRRGSSNPSSDDTPPPGLPGVAAKGRRQSMVSIDGEGGGGGRMERRRSTKNAWGDPDDDVPPSLGGRGPNTGRRGSRGGEYSQAEFVQSEGDSSSDDEETEPAPPPREDRHNSVLDKKKSRVGSKYFI